VRAQSGSGGVRRGVELRLARAAACVAMAGVASLPFAGWLGSSDEVVATGPAPTTTTAPPVAAPPPTTPPPPATTVPPPPPPVAAAPVEAPPIVVVDPSAGIGAATAVVEPAVVVASAEAPAADPPPSLPPPPAAGAAAAHPERLWVVSIGIDDYPGDRYDLQAADDDAVAVTDTFVNLGVPNDHIYELLNEEANVAGILAAVRWLVDNAGPDDTAVLFYAGHVRELGGGTEVLVAADGGWVADWYLASELQRLASADAWFAIAGCFAGGFTELLAPGRILTGAAPAGELAYETATFQRSYMVEYLFARAINGRGVSVLTVQAAVAWANERLAVEQPDHVLFQQDDAAHEVSLDGTDRRTAPTPGAPGAPAPPSSPSPPPPTTAPPRSCLLGLLCG
jgi:hypothetical protein